MKTPARLLFGVRTTGTISLTITASVQLPSQVPDLCIRTTGHNVAIPCANGAWIATLEAGDHVIHLPAPKDGSLDSPFTLALSTPATIVASTNLSGTPLMSWTAETAASTDPKNPWPPPLTGSPDAASLADSTWLRSTLTSLGAQLSVDRSAP